MEKATPETTQIHKFTTYFEVGWTPAHEVFPIVNPDGFLVGGFLLTEGPSWKCFLSGRGYPESLYLKSEEPPYLTPVFSQDGSIEKLILSMEKGEESKRVNIQDDE